MNRLIHRFLGRTDHSARRRGSRSSPPAARRQRLTLEPLEDRLVLSSPASIFHGGPLPIFVPQANFALDNGVLTIYGDQDLPNENDTFVVNATANGGLAVTFNGTVLPFDPRPPAPVKAKPPAHQSQGLLKLRGAIWRISPRRPARCGGRSPCRPNRLPTARLPGAARTRPRRPTPPGASYPTGSQMKASGVTSSKSHRAIPAVPGGVARRRDFPYVS